MLHLLRSLCAKIMPSVQRQTNEFCPEAAPGIEQNRSNAGMSPVVLRSGVLIGVLASFRNQSRAGMEHFAEFHYWNERQSAILGESCLE
jgi:hypothetical protein